MKTDFLNLNMKNPIIVAAGPWNKDGHSIRKAIEAGAGAVITESIVSDAIMDVSPRIAYDGKGAQNIRLYSDIQVEGWEREMQIAKSGGGIVIASVSAHTPSEVAYLAAKMERFGADAIEISISNPMGESLEVAASHADVVFEITKEVVSTVKIPVMVKLSQTATNITAVAKAAKEAGAAAISAINTIRCILGVDIENARPMLPTYGGYSGAPIRPIGLAAVASIAQAVDVPVCGIGGIENYRNVLEYIMLGASAVQIGTAVMINGPEKIREISRELEMWAEEKNISKASEKLFVSQPAVSFSIRELEKELNQQLFVRKSKGVELTAFGKILYSQIKDCVDKFDKIEQMAFRFSKLDQGILRIGACTSNVNQILMEYLTEFAKKYPNVQIVMERDNDDRLLQRLTENSLDMIFVDKSDKIADFKIVKTFDVDYQLLGNKKFKEKYVEEDVDFKNFPVSDLIVPSVNNGSRTTINKFFANNSIKFEPKYELDSYILLYDFVKKGFGIAFANVDYYKQAIANEEVYVIFPQFKIKARQIVCLTNFDVSNPALNSFVQIIDKN